MAQPLEAILPPTDSTKLSNVQLLKLKFKKGCPLTVSRVLNGLDFLTLGTKVKDNKKDFHFPVLFDKRILYLETPLCWVPFGKIDTYKNPGAKKDKFGLHLSLQTYTPELQEFKFLIHKLDETVKGLVNLPVDKYCSAVRYSYSNPLLPPGLRCKLSGKKESLQLDLIFEEETWQNPSLETLASFINKNTQARCILEVCNLWCAGEKWGLSYRVHTIQLIHSKIEQPLYK